MTVYIYICVCVLNHQYFFEEWSDFNIFLERSEFHGDPVLKIFLIRMWKICQSVCLLNIFFGCNSISLLYTWKIVIISHIDLFTGNFKNFNTLIFFVHYWWLKLAQNFDEFLNYIDLIYIPKLIILSSTDWFTEHFKNMNTLTFNVLF